MKPEISTLDRIRTRPRFKLYSKLTPEEYSENLRKYLVEHQEEFSGNINREVATIVVRTKEEPYWKPNLALRTEFEDEKTVIRGVFGPSTAVWTFFMFLYFILSILWMVFFTLWFSGMQVKIEEYSWALPASFVILGIIALTYFAARYGQRKAKKEMAVLRRFAIESTLAFEEQQSTEDVL